MPPLAYVMAWSSDGNMDTICEMGLIPERTSVISHRIRARHSGAKILSIFLCHYHYHKFENNFCSSQVQNIADRLSIPNILHDSLF